MENFNISFEFVANLGEHTVARAERRWNGVHVIVSKSKYQQLTPDERVAVLVHECGHAIVECTV